MLNFKLKLNQIDTDISINVVNISNNLTKINNNESDIITLQNNVASNDTDITNLQNKTQEITHNGGINISGDNLRLYPSTASFNFPFQNINARNSVYMDVGNFTISQPRTKYNITIAIKRKYKSMTNNLSFTESNYTLRIVNNATSNVEFTNSVTTNVSFSNLSMNQIKLVDDSIINFDLITDGTIGSKTYDVELNVITDALDWELLHRVNYSSTIVFDRDDNYMVGLNDMTMKTDEIICNNLIT